MRDNDLLKRLSDSDSLTDVLIQMEDFMDSLDLYVFKNWLDGQIWSGPDITRYWVSMELRYEYNEMPDPAGGQRLLKHGAIVKYKVETETVAKPVDKKAANAAALARPVGTPAPKTGEDETEERKYWVVEIRIPRRFIEELDDDDLELHGDDVDGDAVSDARDEDIDSSDAFTDEDGDGVMDDGSEDLGDDEDDDDDSK